MAHCFHRLSHRHVFLLSRRQAGGAAESGQPADASGVKKGKTAEQIAYEKELEEKFQKEVTCQCQGPPLAASR